MYRLRGVFVNEVGRASSNNNEDGYRYKRMASALLHFQCGFSRLGETVPRTGCGASLRYRVKPVTSSSIVEISKVCKHALLSKCSRGTSSEPTINIVDFELQWSGGQVVEAVTI